MQRKLKVPDAPGLADYLAAHARQDAVLARVERETQAGPYGQMQIPPDEGALLTLLARLIGARRALEVGTFTGYSAICIARGLADGGSLTCLELDPERAAIARRNVDDAGVGDRVTIEVGPAQEALERMPVEPQFDLAFIDADKPGYPAYYELVLPRLRLGGLMVLDNMLLRGDVIEPRDDRGRTVAALNRRIADDERVDAALTLLADGVTFVRKR
jgi:caffeoyl-CoA O-methyltransferase